MFNKVLARTVKVTGTLVAIGFAVASAPFWLPEVTIGVAIGGVILGAGTFATGELMENGTQKLADAVFEKYFAKRNTERELSK